MRRLKNKRKEIEINKEMKFIEDKMEYCWEINDSDTYWELFDIYQELKYKKYLVE